MAHRHGTVVLPWGDGEYAFRLSLAEMGELEERRGGVGVWTLRDRLGAGECSTKDVTETIRLALIGGGMKPVEAMQKVAFYGESRPIDESRIVAYQALTASMLRLPGDGEDQSSGEARAAGPVGSTSPPSPAPPPPSA